MMTIQDILDKYNINIVTAGQHHHATLDFHQIDCPFCSPRSEKYRMGIHKSGRFANCWICGSRNIVETIELLTGLPRRAAILLLEGITPTKHEDGVPRAGKLVLPGKLGPLLPAHSEYLRSRGFNPEEIEKLWGVKGIGISSRLQWRIFIPALLRSETVSWTTRSISDETKAKYISARVDEEAVSLKKILYGEQYCRHSIIVNEGPLDAWTVGPGAVATCGIGYSKRQLLLISKYPVRVILFDDEPEAQKRAAKLVADLSVFEGQTYNVTLDGKDASRSSKRDIKKLRETFL